MTLPANLVASNGSVALITGASSGIGKACADYLADRGWRVFAAQRTIAALGKPSIETIQMDVNDDDSVKRGVAEVLSRTNRIDAVINNAGFGIMGAIEDTSIEEAKAQMETNFFGVLRVCRAVLPKLREQRHGYIINMSSLSAVIGLPFSGLYSASKFALEGMTESLRLEVRRFGIHVVLIEPGDFRTRFPDNRRSTAESQSRTTYQEALAKYTQSQDREEAKSPAPEKIARLVYHILQQRRPKLRYPIGMFGQRMIVPLKRFLPQRVLEWLLCRVLGI
jgi:NAD(P)-dependent dehydrogenase (short-subunit alcohol dehydrogenase family)